MKAMHEQGGLPIPGVEHVMQPYAFGEGFGEDPEAFGARAAAAIEERILEVGPENVAAFIGEPVQGAGGVIIPPPGYWPQVEAICRKYGILLVCDEVICGFGRLGHWFGFQHFGVRARYRVDGQGPVVRLPADLRAAVSARHRRDAARGRRRVRARLHLLRPPDLRRGRAEEPRDPRRASGWSSAPPRIPVPTSPRRSTGCAATRWSARPARSASSAPSRSSRTRAPTSASPARKARPARSCATSASRTA